MSDDLADAWAAAPRRPAGYAYSVLRIALGRAVKGELLMRNVATLVDPPTKSTMEMHPLSADEARGFLDAVAAERLAPLYSLALMTGLRQGELLALQWRDPDLDAGTNRSSYPAASDR